MTALAVLTALVLSTTTEAQTRRPWSPQAKGTAIGVGVGGAAGAIINKRNRVVGGLIGGAAGGAAGYAIGKGVDNRRKTNARIAAAEREAAAARREAAEAREQAVLARQEASGRKVTPGQTGVAAAGAVPAAAVAATGLAATGMAAAYTADPMPINNAVAYLLNPSYGNPNSAYPTSEFRRKSW
ncbi:hypothetical protein AWR27_11250 [Spirosoma montaniterrae]|uniref:Glycine zipper domain-containing protein n=1 Tax=Spirosoma montaniterrae TaxID=1178516 RepID=A0A1P9WWX6_9BACT|nr:hypothetical protein AWR27_11250 [Spirosoma montaniterrae]